MINISAFRIFLNKTFHKDLIHVDEFKSDLEFIEVACFDEPFKLAIEVSVETIKISTVSKEPSIDFSLYDYVYNNNNEAENFVLQIKRTGIFPSKIK